MRQLFLLLLLLFLKIFNTSANSKKPILFGTIVDDQQQAVKEAEVFITGKTHVWTSNKEGKFEIHDLDSGKYVLNIFSEGFEYYSKFWKSQHRKRPYW